MGAAKTSIAISSISLIRLTTCANGFALFLNKFSLTESCFQIRKHCSYQENQFLLRRPEGG
jgi:hypothetical protein